MATVLVIDDRRAFRELTRLILQREGLDVIEARDALAGLQRAVEDAPDFVLVAESLRGLGGREVADRLAAEPATRHLPVWVETTPCGTEERPSPGRGARPFVSEARFAAMLLPRIRAWRRMATGRPWEAKARAEVASIGR